MHTAQSVSADPLSPFSYRTDYTKKVRWRTLTRKGRGSNRTLDFTLHPIASAQHIELLLWLLTG